MSFETNNIKKQTLSPKAKVGFFTHKLSDNSYSKLKQLYHMALE
ncbi:hypothetical protein [Niallia taxi]